MSLVSSSIPNFVNGISQQPFTLRLSSQAEVQENGLSTAASGLKKRPPTQHINKQGLSSTDVFTHTINRDMDERYSMMIQHGDLKVYDLAGNPQVVNFPNGKLYLGLVEGAGHASQQFSAVSVADYTFVVNKNVTVAQNLGAYGKRTSETLINIKQGNYGKTYTIFLNGTVAAQFATPNGGDATHAAMISTEYIAKQLIDSLAAKGYTAPWSFAQYGSVIHIINASADFGVTVEDGFNGNAMVAIKDKVSRLSDLPSYARVAGFQVEVAGDTSTSGDNYWVEYRLNSTATGSSAGIWKECPAPLAPTGLDPLTMPHVLVREANGTFTFKAGTWGMRTVGDVVTNPNPTFVGRQINDVFFYRNRLGLLSDENVIFSEAGQYWNFFRTTCTTMLDSDRIDVATTHTKVSILRHAVQFNKTLLLFSDSAQFVIDDTTILTPETVAIKLSTEFPVNADAKPIGVGRNIYFAVDKGNFSAIREYYVDVNNSQNDAADITAHVPKYLPQGVVKIAASPNEDMIAVLSHSERTAIYVYKYYYSGAEKLQSSWSKWKWNSSDYILGFEIIESTMYVMVYRHSGGLHEVHFERLDLSAESIGMYEPFPVHLDRKTRITAENSVYDSAWGVTVLNGAGYEPYQGEQHYVVVSTNNDPSKPIKPGSVYPVTVHTNGVPYVPGANLVGYDLIFGRQYTMRYVLSPITVKQQQGQGQKSDTEGRLQLRKIGFNYAEAGNFTVNVTPAGRQTFSYKFAGKILGISATLGAVTLPTGKFDVPVMSRNIGTTIEIINDSPLPSSFLSADWEGFYVKRSQSV